MTPPAKTGRFWIMPPRLVLVLLAGAGLIHWALGARPVLRSVPAGGVLIALAIVLNVWADQVFKSAQTPIRPDEMPAGLVSRGPFAFSRNPMYLGLVAFVLGVAFLVGTVPFWCAPVVLWLVLGRVFVRHEERVLRAQFGSDFDAYRERVPRWLIPPVRRPPHR